MTLTPTRPREAANQRGERRVVDRLHRRHDRVPGEPGQDRDRQLDGAVVHPDDDHGALLPERRANRLLVLDAGSARGPSSRS